MFKVGQQVSIIDEAGVYTVIHIGPNAITIKDEYGFDHISSPSELVLLPSVKSVQQVDHTTLQEKEGFAGSSKKSKAHKKNQPKKRHEYDLHAGVLLGNTAGLTNHQILTEQLEFARDMIDQARKSGRAELIFIHGKGKGKLRSELHKMLKGMDKLDFFDADFQKYSLGATEVHLK